MSTNFNSKENLISNIQPKDKIDIDQLYELVRFLQTEVEKLTIRNQSTKRGLNEVTSTVDLTVEDDVFVSEEPSVSTANDTADVTTVPSSDIKKPGALCINGRIIDDKGIMSSDYKAGLADQNTGYFLGPKYSSNDKFTHLEVDTIRVRKGFIATQNLMQASKAINGNLFVSSTGKVKFSCGGSVFNFFVGAAGENYITRMDSVFITNTLPDLNNAKKILVAWQTDKLGASETVYINLINSFGDKFNLYTGSTYKKGLDKYGNTIFYEYINLFKPTDTTLNILTSPYKLRINYSDPDSIMYADINNFLIPKEPVVLDPIDISGIVKTSGDVPIAGVVITLVGGLKTINTTTGSDGKYLFSNIAQGIAYTITPSLINYTFVENKITLTVTQTSSDVTLQNFTGTLVPPPTISSISPETGLISGGTAVTITGSYFNSGVSVKFGSKSATDIVVVSDTEITCKTPSVTSAASTSVIITNTNLGTVTKLNGFTYISLSGPTIDTITPNTGIYTGGTLINITGTNFVSGATILIDDNVPTKITFIDSKHLTCITPVGIVGPVNITVTNPNGNTFTRNYCFSYYNETGPTITSVVPTNGSLTGGTSVTINGTGFQSGAYVKFDGEYATNNIWSSPIAMTCKTPVMANRTVASISVYNPDGSYGSKPDLFYFTGGNYSNFSFTLSGYIKKEDNSPIAGVSVLLKSSVAIYPKIRTITAYDGSYSLKMPSALDYEITLDLINYKFTGDLTLSAIDTDTTSLSRDFVGTYYPPIEISGEITSIMEGVTVYITDDLGNTKEYLTTDDGLYSFTVPQFGNYMLTPYKANCSFIPASISINDETSVEDVVNQNFVGTFYPTPTLTSIVPKYGSLLTTTDVTITGTGFQSGATVKFGNILATNVVVLNETSITCTAPIGASSGKVDITITNDSLHGSAALVSTTSGFSYFIKINGYIKISNIANVLLPMSMVSTNIEGKTCFTNDAGYYELSVEPDKKYTITPTKENYIFKPVNTIIEPSEMNIDVIKMSNQQNIISRDFTALYNPPNNDIESYIPPIPTLYTEDWLYADGGYSDLHISMDTNRNTKRYPLNNIYLLNKNSYFGFVTTVTPNANFDMNLIKPAGVQCTLWNMQKEDPIHIWLKEMPWGYGTPIYFYLNFDTDYISKNDIMLGEYIYNNYLQSEKKIFIQASREVTPSKASDWVYGYTYADLENIYKYWFTCKYFEYWCPNANTNIIYPSMGISYKYYYINGNGSTIYTQESPISTFSITNNLTPDIEYWGYKKYFFPPK